MDYTIEQKRALNFLKLAKVTYHKDMYKHEKALGYNTVGTPYDMIHIAEDLPNEDVKKIVLIHEVGHTYFNHIRLNIKEEIINIKQLFKKNGVKFSRIQRVGGPMHFLNICMDFEVNSKLLTFNNIDYMNEVVGKLCVPKDFGIDYQETFRDYYEPLILFIKKKDEEAKKRNEEQKKSQKNKQSSSSDSDYSMSEDDSDEDSDEGDTDSGSSQKSKSSKKSSSESGDSNFDEDGESDFSDEDSDDDFDDNDEDLDDDYDKEDSEDEDSSSDSCKDIIDQLNKDIVGDVSVFDEDFDDETKEELKEEDYETPDNSESSRADNKDSNPTTIEDEFRKDNVFAYDGDSSRNAGTSLYDVKSNCVEVIQDFLKKIVRTSYTGGNWYHNYLKGARRGESDILYSTMKRTFGKSSKKLGVLIDVSSSMYVDSVVIALKSVKDYSKNLHKDSLVATWDYNLVEEFSINEIPDYVKIGDWTKIDLGVDYLINKKKCDEIVVYSDFETDMEKLIKVVRSNRVGIHSIVVGFNSEYTLKGNPLLKDYLNLNKSYILVSRKKDVETS